jgi:hypothetical protein
VCAALALADPAEAQGPRVNAFPSLDDTTATGVPGPLRAPLDTAWLSAGLLTPVPEVDVAADEAGLPGGPSLPMAGFVGDTTLPCLEWECENYKRKKQFWRGAGELILVQLIPNLFSRLSGAEWAKFTPATWAQNIKFTWQWDNNAFLNNQFSHPYHGNLYFNTARTNGYSFWGSFAWPWAGSLMWELMGEVWAPAPNDLMNTAMGGITLGEMLYRMSSLTLDNEATGTERVFREIGATILNPVRGFNRALDGTMFKRSQTPAEWRPSTVFGDVELGYRYFQTNETTDDPLSTGFVRAALRYGDYQKDALKAPFSLFRVDLMLVGNPGAGASHITELNVRGSLGGVDVSHGTGARRFVGFMTYEYVSNPVIEYGAQGFTGGFLNTYIPKSPKKPILYTELTAIFNPVAAIKSDYFLIAEGRDYDYGIGLGARAEARLMWTGKAFVTAWARYRFIPIISGFPGDHQFFIPGFDARWWYKGRIGVGVSGQYIATWANYTDRNDVNDSSTEGRIYLTTAIPRWENN